MSITNKIVKEYDKRGNKNNNQQCNRDSDFIANFFHNSKN